ncbi:dienelactone hydrolase family protein [Pedobacter alpinus]|uniref:Dienelactone hydrolase family protein n=1 Tax=Pedobacter alpinus TaxID=1590643 RepID=A0ABW5TQJ5_9SPHI
MDQKIINLYDEYTHSSKMDRKGFISRLAKITGGMAVALTILPLLENNYAVAGNVDTDDLLITDITYQAKNGIMKAHLAQPKGKKNLGSILVIHENRGLNAHTKDVANRFAKEGYIAMAVDALSPFGGTPTNEDEARALFSKLDAAQNLQNFLDGLNYLRTLPNANGKVACVGFCWGGGMANDLAVNDAKLNAAVAYYGRQAKSDDVPKIKTELLLHYGGLDERINAGITAYREALEKNNIKHQIFIYEGVNHAFNNDTSPTRYNAEAAKLAWDRNLALFKKNID